MVQHVNEEADETYLQISVVGELLYGARNSSHVQKNIEKINEFFQTTVFLNLTRDTADYYSEIRLELKQAGTPIPVNDLWIAALSRQHDLPVTSRDTHFDNVRGLTRLAR